MNIIKLKIIIENQQVKILAKNTWLSDLLFLSMLISLFYTLWLGNYPFFTPDEGRYSEVAREMVATGDYITPRVNGVAFLDKPVLYYWLQAAAIQLFGVKEWAIRLFPALLGIFGCLMTYICGRRLFSRRTGFISALILATTPLYFGGAHYANLDLEVAVFISSTLLCFITGIFSTGKTRSFFLFSAYIFAAMAFLTKGLIGFAFPGIIALCWIIILKRWQDFKTAHLGKGITLAIILVLPWYILAQQANPQFLHFFFVTQQVTRFLSTAEFNNPTPFWFYFPVVLVGFFPWTIFLFQAGYHSIRNPWKEKAKHPVELFLLLWLVIVMTFFSIPRCKMIGYILPVFPALALLVGNYLAQVWEQKRISSHILLTTCGLLLGIIIPIVVHYSSLEIPAHLIPYLYALAIIYLATALISLLLLKKSKVLPLFVLCCLCSITLLFTVVLGAKHVNTNSTKPLVMNLKNILQPQDEVAHYYKFYQDVPLYLEKRVTLVANWNAPDIANNDNWVRELWFGMPFQKTDDWLIDKDKFWQRWNSDKRMFVFLSANYFSHFQQHAKKCYIVGEHNRIMLVCNKPLP